MFDQYQLGGILAAIQSSTTAKKKKSKKRECDEKTPNCNVEQNNEALINLFSYKEPVEDEYTEDQLNLYLENTGGDKDNQNNKDTKKHRGEKAVVEKKKKQKESPERLARTLFLGNVSTTVTRKTLKKLFIKFGEIESVRVRSVPTADPKVPKKVALIKKEFHSERNNMNAYVVFKNKEDIDKAMKCNGMLLEGLHLRVDKSSNKKHEHRKCLFVGNLPFSCAEEDIRTHFKGCGEVEDVRLIRDKASGLGKGFGYVRFKNTDGVLFGLKLNGSDFNGRSLRVYRSSEQPNKDNKGGTRKTNSFQGLRATSKKDLEEGKQVIGHMKRPNNAMRRIENKQKKRIQQKHSKNKQRNINKKVNKRK